MKMLYYNKIDVSEGVNINKAGASKECYICHYWYFLYKASKFQPQQCNRSYDLLMTSMNLSNIAILKTKIL